MSSGVVAGVVGSGGVAQRWDPEFREELGAYPEETRREIVFRARCGNRIARFASVMFLGGVALASWILAVWILTGIADSVCSYVFGSKWGDLVFILAMCWFVVAIAGSVIVPYLTMRDVNRGWLRDRVEALVSPTECVRCRYSLQQLKPMNKHVTCPECGLAYPTGMVFVDAGRNP